jgi:hypothetical protein
VIAEDRPAGGHVGARRSHRPSHRTDSCQSSHNPGRRLFPGGCDSDGRNAQCGGAWKCHGSLSTAQGLPRGGQRAMARSFRPGLAECAWRCRGSGAPTLEWGPPRSRHAAVGTGLKRSQVRFKCLSAKRFDPSTVTHVSRHHALMNPPAVSLCLASLV